MKPLHVLMVLIVAAVAYYLFSKHASPAIQLKAPGPQGPGGPLTRTPQFEGPGTTDNTIDDFFHQK